MDKNFERRLELAKNPRARKRNGKKKRKFIRPKSHTAAVLGEILDGATSGGGRIYQPNPYVMAQNGIDATIGAPLLAAHHLAIAAAMDGVATIKKRRGKKERMKSL